MGKEYSRPRGVSATSLLKLDGFLLHGVFVPMILLAATAKVGAVFSVSIVPPRGWALLDFLRLHLGYYLLFYLWFRVMHKLCAAEP